MTATAIFDPSDCGNTNICVRGGTCKTAFSNIRIIPRVRGITTVVWSFSSTEATAPVRFRLEVGRAPHNESNDWEPVTELQEGVTTLQDTKRRSHGWYRLAYYRILAEDAAGRTFTSTPQPATGTLMSSQQESMFREIVRRERLRARRRMSEMSQGALLKVRYYGEPCTECAEPNSGLPLDDRCPSCFGVGYKYGYYHPIACFAVDLGNLSHDLKMFESQFPRIEGNTAQIRFLNIPFVHPWDVWVDYSSDNRYLIGQISPQTSLGALPVICNAAVARLAYTHPAYAVPVYPEDKPALFFGERL